MKKRCKICEKFESETSTISHESCARCGSVYHTETAGTAVIILNKECNCPDPCLGCNEPKDGSKCNSEHCRYCAN